MIVVTQYGHTKSLVATNYQTLGGYNQDMIVTQYLTNIEYTTFLVKSQKFFLTKFPNQKKKINKEDKKS